MSFSRPNSKSKLLPNEPFSPPVTFLGVGVGVGVGRDSRLKCQLWLMAQLIRGTGSQRWFGCWVNRSPCRSGYTASHLTQSKTPQFATVVEKRFLKTDSGNESSLTSEFQNECFVLADLAHALCAIPKAGKRHGGRVGWWSLIFSMEARTLQRDKLLCKICPSYFSSVETCRMKRVWMFWRWLRKGQIEFWAGIWPKGLKSKWHYSK